MNGSFRPVQTDLVKHSECWTIPLIAIHISFCLKPGAVIFQNLFHIFKKPDHT